MKSRLREQIGCWLHERWRLELATRLPRLADALRLGWMDSRNRNEHLSVDMLSGGRICSWEHSSSLTVARLFPEAASRLLSCSLAQWPIDISPRPRASRGVSSPPEISIIIGVRGTARLAQFSACLDSCLNQKGTAVEVIVVEQSWQAEFPRSIPSGVRYEHQQATSPAMPYNRAWALNRGARLARGRVLILHDADMLLPVDCASAVARIVSGDTVGVRLPRLLYYLDEVSSLKVQNFRTLIPPFTFERVIANNRTPIAMEREAYLSIGGHDEAFFGWGAEDDEFMQRARCLNFAEGAFMPIVHLWHPTAAANEARSRNADLLRQLEGTPAPERSKILADRAFGQPVPSVGWNMVGDS